MDSRSEKTTKKKRKWLRITLITLGVLVLLSGVYIYSVYHSLTNAVDTMHQPIKRIGPDKRTDDLNLGDKHPFSVLLLGVDQRVGDVGRSDTIIVMTVNPKKQSIQMVSIPRDTRTQIIGKGFDDKINHAYAFGGVEMSMATVENFLDIPIDYYVQVNMEGFKEIVDAVGGVTVQNDLDFTYGGVHFPKGQLDLNGDEALKYSRMRYEDPRGDFGRQQRQRQIIQAVIKEGASLNTLFNYGDIFNALGKNVRTNMTFDEMLSIQSKYKSATNKMEQHQIKGQGQMIDSIYYYIVPEEERQRLQQLLKGHLELN